MQLLLNLPYSSKPTTSKVEIKDYSDKITNIKCYRVRVGSKQYRLTHVGTKTSCVVLMWKSTFRVLPVTFLGWPWMKPINQTSVSAFSRRMHRFIDVLGLPDTRGLIEQIGKHFVKEFFKLARIV
ncbi:hypothetical protein P5673_007767 [Acropora cervicornis]|uniref:Uncharacterized protein n=1 Tax=Acropora cervicornis TaxID=6130 RepID=A0AAD9QUZ1_ACRCE|nr:hypothetical protein P5673_007767 [Acropora cervicornis]